MFLDRRRKEIAEKVASQSWAQVGRDAVGLTPEQQFHAAKSYAEREVTTRRKEIAGRHGFGSVIGSIILSLVLRYAWKLLEQYLKDAIFSEQENERQ